MNPWHRTPAGGLQPGPYPDVPGYAAAARGAYDTGQAVELEEPAEAADVRPEPGARGVS